MHNSKSFIAIFITIVFVCALSFVSCSRQPAPQSYAPPPEAPGTAIGAASLYGTTDGFAGRKTASGERFDPNALTAAHRTLPFGTRVRVTNLKNSKHVVVRINDRGPFERGRIIDLSQRAAREIGLTDHTGVAQVKLEPLG